MFWKKKQVPVEVPKKSIHEQVEENFDRAIRMQISERKNRFNDELKLIRYEMGCARDEIFIKESTMKPALWNDMPKERQESLLNSKEYEEADKQIALLKLRLIKLKARYDEIVRASVKITMEFDKMVEEEKKKIAKGD
jgi:hypothetical protein